MNLTETPFFVVDLSTVEHVHFERVNFATRNFDMVIIFKDFDVPPRIITAIEITYYDAIQDWLNDVEITFTSGVQSMNWAKIMSDVVKCDPRFYYDTDENGEKKPAGWTFLGAADSDEEDDDNDEEDSNFDAEEEGSEEEDEEEEEDDSDFEEEDDEDEEDADEELEEEGKVSDSI